MAEAPGHLFGQIIGNLLEEILSPVLTEFCELKGLYLDKHGARQGVRKGKKVSWLDKHGNTHDLDFVIEKNAAPDRQGVPVAFIEAAWRRYTKHSKNKAQEIQAAVLPIAEKYSDEKPFLGAVIAGEFTAPAFEQLRSVGFKTCYIPYETVVKAFETVGIDARFDEGTSAEDFSKCIRIIEQLSLDAKNQLKRSILELNRQAFDDFLAELKARLERLIERVTITPLFGTSNQFIDLGEAEIFLKDFNKMEAVGSFQKYEIGIKYSNGDDIRGMFSSKEAALDFINRATA
jgi:hypothetical protein